MIENLLLFAFSLNQNKNLDIVKSQVEKLNIEKNRVVDFIPLNDSYLNTKKINKDAVDINNNFKSGVIFDYDTGEIYWQKNIDERRSIASLTKIMTVLVFLDLDINIYNYTEVINDVLVNNDAEAARIGFRVGDNILIKDLLYSGYIGSKNDAINLLVKSTGLSMDEFVKKMNEKAKELKLDNTVFKNVNGLDNQNISTARDLSKLVYYAFSNNTIKTLSQIKEYTFQTKSGKIYTVKNTNKLLDNKNFSILAGKTGYLDEALYCYTLLSKKDNRKLVSILLGNDTDDNRFNDAEALNLWVYKNWK